MSKTAYFNPKSKKWIISLIVMIILSVGVVFGTIAINKAVTAKNSEPVEIEFTIASTRPVNVIENELGVTGVEEAYDSTGAMVAYVIKQQVVGYNQESPIEMSTTITKDNKVVCGIEIIKQEETEYLGVRICEDGFKNQFNGKKLPIKGAGSISKGSEVDLIARSTISSQAVVDGVNNAQAYLNLVEAK